MSVTSWGTPYYNQWKEQFDPTYHVTVQFITEMSQTKSLQHAGIGRGETTHHSQSQGSYSASHVADHRAVN